MLLSIALPAFEEESYIGRTPESLNRASAFIEERCGASVEVIVVDKDSSDATSKVARGLGARVLGEAVHNIA